MSNKLNLNKFEEIYKNFIEKGSLNEVQTYYSIYKKRYLTLIKRYNQIALKHPQKVLDIGGGQYALLCKKLWNDDSTLIDITNKNFNYMNTNGVRTIKFNLASDEINFDEKFDVIFFSEVIEHIPIPGHIILEKLKRILKPNGYIICTTPNLFRIRNIIFLAMGKNIYDFFRYSNESMGHILEYSKEHLEWQFRKAGFNEISCEILQLHSSRTKITHRLLAWLGSPIYFFVPRFRDNLLLIAKNNL